jgi:hypothetical protein
MSFHVVTAEFYGCTPSQLEHLRQVGREMRAAGASIRQCPVTAFVVQRKNAASRGVPFKLTLWEWWSVWQESGKWSERARYDGYVMSRRGDQGAYEVGNVFIDTNRNNCSLTPRKVSGLPVGVWADRQGKYIAARYVDGKRRRLGRFADPNEAHRAYLSAGRT